MFTICFAFYASLVSVTPTETHCVRVDKPTLDMYVRICEADNHDPLMTCEARRAGALKWFITRRYV